MKIDFKSFLKHFTKEKKNLFPTGSRVYYGYQGNGKTLSMVRYVKEIKKQFPKCLVFSNVDIFDIEYIPIRTPADLSNALSVANGDRGVLVCLDEAHLFFNNTRGGISLDVLTAISQQRKDRRKIVFTSQIWEELDISLRKQVPEVIKCKRLGNIIILTHFIGYTMKYHKQENEFIADKDYTEIYKLNDELTNSYNTYQKIVTNSEYKREFANNSYRTANNTYIKK
jgi:hypothetical protein